VCGQLKFCTIEEEEEEEEVENASRLMLIGEELTHFL